LFGPERQLRVSAAVIVGEFDLEDALCERFDDRPDLAAVQALVRQVDRQGYDNEPAH
jgi:hypothetical protein